MPPVKPKKALGQHFLTDKSVARRIAESINDCPGLPVVEVGPGTGVLTRFLVEAGRNPIVIELDRESVAYLKEGHIEGLAADHIIEGDFLKTDLNALADGEKLCVIGNYPYNISSQIFFKVLDDRDIVEECAGMVQKEVAERLCARPGGKTRGILSVLLQLWYDVEYLFTVSEHVFNPPPKVKSGVIRMKRNGRQEAGCDFGLMRTVVKTSFGQRRKTLRNSLKGLLPAGQTLPEDVGLFGMRPEQLTVEEFVELTNIMSELRIKE